jgi:hypothetical protein
MISKNTNYEFIKDSLPCIIMENFTPVANSVFSSFEIDESYMPAVGDEDKRFQELRRVLILRIEELIARDTEKLMWVLYRIDVNEKKVHEALTANSSLNYAEVLVDLDHRAPDRESENTETV